MSTASARETELLEKAYAYVLEHGLADMSLRPLATAIGSSPRVLLVLFDSKDELVARLLSRAREDELAMLSDPPDLMIVLGGYNSSNTNNLARICEQVVPTFHIDDSSCIEGPDVIRHKPVTSDAEIVTPSWLPDGPVTVGLTAGASTPNNKVGQTIERLLACRGLQAPVPA